MKALSTPEILKRTRQSGISGSWVPSQHCIEQMNRRGYTAPDIERLLMNGIHVPKFDTLENGTWRYRIHGKTIDGKSIGVAVVIDEDVIVVTILNPQGKKHDQKN